VRTLHNALKKCDYYVEKLILNLCSFVYIKLRKIIFGRVHNPCLGWLSKVAPEVFIFTPQSMDSQ